MYSVHTGTYHFKTLKYVPGTYFFPRVHTQKQTFLISLNLVHTGTYSRKKVCSEYILREKSMYQVQTSYVRLYRYHTIAWYIPVCTGMNSVHTTVHDSR